MSRLLIVLLLYSISTLTYSQSRHVFLGEVTHRTANVTYTKNHVFAGRSFDSYYLQHAEGGNEGLHRGISLESSFSGLMPGETYKIIEVAQHPLETAQLDTTLLLTFTTPIDWEHRMSAPDFSFVTGSCSYVNESKTDRPGVPYGGAYTIYHHMASESADFNLWLGDNIYLRPSDYTSEYGIERRYINSRQLPDLQELLTSRPNYAIWDDHDAGPNNCVGTFALIDETREVFKSYWPRESYGTPEVDDLRWISTYSDCVFIGLDNRSHRTSEHSSNPQILGKEQIDWLVSQVRFHRSASFIVVAIGGQVLNSAAVYENYAQYPEEREYLLSQLAEIGYENLVFFTGDRHHSERSQIEIDAHRIVDFTVSPMTSGPSTVVADELNENRIGNYIDERNYAVVSITGQRGERIMTVTYKNSEGEEISRHTIESL